MKFTKLLALALVLVMLVSAFVACGGGADTETNPPETEPKDTETEPKDTETEPKESESETETENDCEHPANRQRKMDEVAPTCTEAGYIDYLCRLCDAEWRLDLPATHTYGVLASVDGKYIRNTCIYCGSFYVTDETGATVEDASAIDFPFFATDFTDAESFADLLGGFPEIKLVKEEFIAFVVNEAENNTYINIPTGTSALAPNGYFEISDTYNKLTTKDFSIKLAVQFTEFPTETIGLVTWKLDGAEYDLVSVDANGVLSVLGSTQSKVLTDKGWDVVEICFDNETGDYYVYLNDQIFAKGNVGVAVAGKTGSALRFFEGVGQFEAYADNFDVKFIAEAKTDACIHVYAKSSETPATCETEGKISYKCSLCQATYEETVAAYGHKLGSTTFVDPTCTTAGSTTATCERCNQKIVEEIPALGHKIQWSVVDGTPVQTCSACSHSAIFVPAGDPVLYFDFNQSMEESIGDKISVPVNNATIVEQDGNMILDTKTTRINDSENYEIFGLETMLFTAKIKVSQHAHTSEKKESMISFINGYAGGDKVGTATPWGICLGVICSTDGTTQLSLGKTLEVGHYVTATPEQWYDVTIIGCTATAKYYLFIGDTFLGTVSKPEYDNPLYGGGATLRLGENGDCQAFMDDVTVYSIVAK